MLFVKDFWPRTAHAQYPSWWAPFGCLTVCGLCPQLSTGGPLAARVCRTCRRQSILRYRSGFGRTQQTPNRTATRVFPRPLPTVVVCVPPRFCARQNPGFSGSNTTKTSDAYFEIYPAKIVRIWRSGERSIPSKGRDRSFVPLSHRVVSRSSVC